MPRMPTISVSLSGWSRPADRRAQSARSISRYGDSGRFVAAVTGYIVSAGRVGDGCGRLIFLHIEVAAISSPSRGPSTLRCPPAPALDSVIDRRRAWDAEYDAGTGGRGSAGCRDASTRLRIPA